jgi:hypothetical protein
MDEVDEELDQLAEDDYIPVSNYNFNLSDSHSPEALGCDQVFFCIWAGG